MTRNQQPALTAFAVGMIGLGVLAIIYRDFAMVWQPVPAWVPAYTFVAFATGVIMFLGGVALVLRSTAAGAIRILFPYIFLWMLLKLPPLFAQRKMEGNWLGFGELAVLMTGGWILFARLSELKPGSALSFLSSERTVYFVQKFFGLWLIPIGLSHFVYAQASLDLVPGWLPYRMGWVYLSGAGHIAAGLGVLFGVFPRAAAFAESAMIGCFTLMIWAPRVIAEPRSRPNWTAFFISWTIGAGAWCVAQSVAAKRESNQLAAAAD